MPCACGKNASFKRCKDKTILSVSNDVVRRICDEEGRGIKQWAAVSPEPKKVFAAAKGVVEFSTDGLKLNTVDGWREIRLSVMGKREPVAAAAAAQWAGRVLETPTARMAICAIAPCGHVGASWERLAKTLGLPRDQDLSVIADGAKWIWSQAAKRFKGKGVQWVVDVYHLMLYLHAVAAEPGAGLAGKDAGEWVGGCVVELIQRGGPKFIEHLHAIGPPASTATPSPAWKKLLHYLDENRDSLWYDRRLKEGLPIGSGLIEGGCKNVLAKRLKLNSARWRIRRAEHMGAIRCLQYSGLWESYWDSKKAAA